MRASPCLLISVFVLVSAVLLDCTVVHSQEPVTEPEVVEQGKASENSRELVGETQLFRQFRNRIFPLLKDSDKGCIDCHDSESTSNLVLSGNPRDDFRLLLDEQYLKLRGADTLLSRVSTEHAAKRMPKDAAGWSEEEIKRLKNFARSLKKSEVEGGVAADEQFPRSLLSPYRGPTLPATENQFLSYRQLKGKIKVLFGDDWVRDDRDLFAENVALFGGADFKTRYNESSQPSASFLSGMEMLSRDVANRAFERRAGPFEDWDKYLNLPADAESVAVMREAVDRLYRHILYRPATVGEIDQSLNLLRNVHELRDDIQRRDDELTFELQVSDPVTGLVSQRLIQIPINADSYPVRQFWVDQSREGEVDDSTVDRAEDAGKSVRNSSRTKANQKNSAEFQRMVLGAPVELVADDPEQQVVLHNLGTLRNVSFASLEIIDSEGRVVQEINAQSSQLQAVGAWQIEGSGHSVSLEDKGQHKGLSFIRIPLVVAQPGKYSIAIVWRTSKSNADRVLVELFAGGLNNELVVPPVEEAPAHGLAHFTYDSSDDARPFFNPEVLFRFDDEGAVEIRNENTLDTVTVGGIEFVPQRDAKEFLIDSIEADGSDEWSKFDEGRFKAYNVKGKKLHDDNKRKGKLALAYRPSIKKDKGWSPDEFYGIRVYYPGKRDQECQVPVVVRARQSSPIIRVSHPLIANADATLVIDASKSYTVQGGELKFTWRQVGGPSVAIADIHASKLEFVTPRKQVDQVAWVSLCSALLRHPDFLFTRPPSLLQCDASQAQSLLLVKMALDLVGRSPTRMELEALNSGRSLTDMATVYLDSEEFRDFYFHRIRLYLESQGTVEQDEPVRLWCHVAFNDLPFKEILTANYTIDVNGKKVDRPAYHGKTGILTTPGFIQGKPGLPHYNYAAQVSMLFLGYVYEVPAEIVELREGVTALGTTDPNSVCYSCHKILTPLAFQRLNWDDDGKYREVNEDGLAIDASDRSSAEDYPFVGNGLEAFATQAVEKERFIRTLINTHFSFYFGRPMRHREDERDLYRRLWDDVHANNFQIRSLIHAIVTSPEYLATANR
jgi:hypothetical protein